MECSICFEAITAATGSTQLSCSHSFHFRCLVQWFDSQTEKELKESCPCCRHEANEHEQLPIITSEDEEYEEESVVSFGEESLADAAARERAAGRFATLKRTLSKEDMEIYAATTITAAVRGYWARKIAARLAQAAYCCETAMKVIRKNLSRLTEARVRDTFHRKSVGLSRAAWKAFCAKTIQRAVRHWIPRLRAERLAISTLTITWRHTEKGWERVVLNPEEQEPEVWTSRSIGLPPQSLVFQQSYYAKKIQALWRGHRVRTVLCQS